MMQTNESALCAHTPCSCTVSAGQHYCSDYCRTHAAGKSQDRVEGAGQTERSQHPTGGCGCGHSGCR